MEQQFKMWVGIVAGHDKEIVLSARDGDNNFVKGEACNYVVTVINEKHVEQGWRQLLGCEIDKPDEQRR